VHCPVCRAALAYVHGHAACVNGRCPLFGANQAECCSGETAESCPAQVDVRPQGRQHSTALDDPKANAAKPRR
jgi:hypothetical protein